MILTLFLLACGTAEQPEPTIVEPAVVRDADLDPRDHSIPRSYDELLADAYPATDGFVRAPATPFTTWLRARKIGPAFQAIVTWRGDAVVHPGRLVRMGLLGPGQLAHASALRVRAEYLLEAGLPVSLPAASGTPQTYDPAGDWDAYLDTLFRGLGAEALASATEPVSDPLPGDLLLSEDGSHVVLILDVARRGDEVRVLVGEGHIPAQVFHVEHGPYDYWWPWNEVLGPDGFREPMPASGLRRWKE